MTSAAVSALVPSPAQRRADVGVGASEAAVATGVSEYRRPIDLWLEKTKRREHFAGNEKTFWGNALEPIIRAHYVEKHGVTVFVPPTSLFHKEHTFVRATPDGIVIDPQFSGEAGWLFVGPQVKNVGLRMAPAWQDDGGARMTPVDYYVQGVVEMAVTDLPRIDFAVLLGGQEYFEVTLERDKTLEADVLEQLAKFWALVESDRQPELDDSASFRGHLLKQIKRRAHVAAGDEDVKLLLRWREVVQQAKVLKTEESAIKNRIAAALAKADAHRMTSELGDITVGAPRKKTAWKAVAEQLGATLPTLGMLDRELVALRGDAEEECGPLVDAEIHPLVQRIDGMRAQLRLAGELASYPEVVQRHTALGEPVMNRPRAWTRDVDDANESEES